MQQSDTNRQSRRAVLRNAAMTVPLLSAPAWAQEKQSAAAKSEAKPGGYVYAYVGSYTTPKRNGRGDGINVYRMDLQTGAWSHLQHLGNLVNPSFVILSKDQRFLYSVHGDEAYATSFAVDQKTGFLTPMNQGKTGGENGVRQQIDASGKFMVVANYAAGTVAVLPVKADGSLGDYIQLAELKGEPGPHRVEQSSSHPHDIAFDPSGRFVAVPDKGLDRVFVFHFDAASGKLTPTQQGSVVARAGSAPRHIAFHPKLPYAWVINEINSSVTTYHWDAASGALKPIQILPSLPPDFTGNSTGAEILVSGSGRFVYCSNRGHDSVAAFAVDPQTGLLKSIGWTPSQGKSPRFIGLDPSQRFLCATNEQGDNVVTLRADAATGRLTATGQIVHTGSPVTIAFRR